MIKTTDYTIGVKRVISRARESNSEIGFYQEHFITENFRFIIRLSNGRLEMTIEVAQDCEAQPNRVTVDRIECVAKTFTSFQN
jgi:hypothetical protein